MRTGALCAALLAPPAHAQHAHGAGPAARGWLGAQAVALVTHADPVVDGDARTEATLSQPMLMAGGSAWAGRLTGTAMLNLEAVTLPDGEPNAGIWGEGFVDRRHPHTLLHELAATLGSRAGGRVGWSLTAGRGFVPFGSDDPMARPFVKYPLNHHLAQVLERLVVVGAVHAGPARVEAALFNGDEPTGPRSLGAVDRFGDAWSVRATVVPFRGVELGASHARLASPEQPSGGGLDQHKTHLSARWERDAGGSAHRYVFLEWARTDELNAGRRSFRFHTALAEAALGRGASQAAARFEQTERPDEERLADPFRTPFPHPDVNLLGITRWRVATLSLSHRFDAGGVRVRPVLEGSRQWIRALRTPAAFVPVEFYGADRLWSVSLGARVEVGAAHAHRPGRYGAAAPHP